MGSSSPSGLEPTYLALHRFFTTGPPGKSQIKWFLVGLQPRHTPAPLAIRPETRKSASLQVSKLKTRGSSEAQEVWAGHHWLPRFQLHGENRCEEKKVLSTWAGSGVCVVGMWAGWADHGAGSTWVPVLLSMRAAASSSFSGRVTHSNPY